jgi:hypothetical protein
MCPAIDSPASCEARAVSVFIHAKNVSAEKILCELGAAVYGRNVMSEGTVKQWCAVLKDGRANRCSQ